MKGFTDKVIGLILCLYLMVIGPNLRAVQADLITQRREIYNEVTNMLDAVTDTGEVTNAKLEDFYLGVASKGIPVDITVERYIKVVNPNGAGGTYYTYTFSDKLTDWNKGDICRIRVKQLTRTNKERLVSALAKTEYKNIDFTLSGRVRN